MADEYGWRELDNKKVVLNMKQLVLALMFLSLAAAASAQTPTITGLTVTVQTAAGVQVGTPQTAVWPLAAGSCGLPLTPDPVGTVINPQFARLVDPANAAFECRQNFAAYFASFPAASGYRLTLKFLYSDGIAGGASNVSTPFDVQLVRAVPMGAGVR